MNKFKNFISVTLAILVMVLPLQGFGFDMHFCQTDLVDVSVFSEAQTCCSSNSAQLQNTSNIVQLTEKGCCTDVNFAHASNESLLSIDVVKVPVSVLTLALVIFQFFDADLISFTSSICKVEVSSLFLQQCDINVLFQSFLI